MLNLNLQSLLSIIRLTLLLLVNVTVSYSQDQKMERLELQYQLMFSTSEKEKESLNLAVANKFIDHGDYESAIKFNDKVKVNAENKDFKRFLYGKAEFLIDNYKGSLSFLDSVNEQKIDKKYYWEMQLYKTLNFNHLLKIDSTYKTLSLLLLKNNVDTLDLAKELNSIPKPKFLDLKKARRKSSLFPGSGLYYVGEKKRAVTSAMISLAFLGYTAYSIYTQYYFTAALTGGAQFLRFYNGGKRASLKIGTKKNREAYIKYVLNLDDVCGKKIFALSKFNN